MFGLGWDHAVVALAAVVVGGYGGHKWDDVVLGLKKAWADIKEAFRD
jgi:hypothetical protein